MTDNFEKNVIRYVECNNLLAAGENIIIGVSGGRDSMSLMYFLHDYSKKIGFNIYAVHVNHMIRGKEAERDREFTKTSCRKLGIPCTAVDIDVRKISKEHNISLEEAGRRARYKAFEEEAKRIAQVSASKSTKVAVAHHRDDNVETILLNMARGSGINGLSGISAITTNGELTIIRPFLCVGRNDIDNYALEKKIGYVDDATNFTEDYTRNKIRLKVIPEILKVNSRAPEHIIETAQDAAMALRYIDLQADKIFRNVTHTENDGSVVIDIGELQAQEEFLQSCIIQKTIRYMSGTMKDITRTHIKNVVSLKDKATGKCVELPYGLRACKRYGEIVIRKIDTNNCTETEKNIEISMEEIKHEKKLLQVDGELSVCFEVMEVNDSNREIFTRKNQFTKAFDCDKIKGNLNLGKSRPGDKITIIGGRKSLGRFFIDEKVSPDARKKALVLKDAESVLWVIGYRIGEAYKITNETTRILKIDIIGGNNE